MRSLRASLAVFVLSITLLVAQDHSAAQPYHDADAYKIYSLLLPHEESYGFAEDTLMIQENTLAEDIMGACLKQPDATRFKGAIAGYNRIYKKKWALQPQFQIAKPYRIVGVKVISGLPDDPQGAVSYVSLSPVGFNQGKTQAIVFVRSSCGGLCGSWRFHFLEHVHGKWNEVRVAMCVGAS
ncbi:MAG: hypothetical protein HY010_05825 [Acidobacteria bacterium]|nr:hypothetical protein [Acidobacteriota bacterium]